MIAASSTPVDAQSIVTRPVLSALGGFWSSAVTASVTRAIVVSPSAWRSTFTAPVSRRVGGADSNIFVVIDGHRTHVALSVPLTGKRADTSEPLARSIVSTGNFRPVKKPTAAAQAESKGTRRAWRGGPGSAGAIGVPHATVAIASTAAAKATCRTYGSIFGSGLALYFSNHARMYATFAIK